MKKGESKSKTTKQRSKYFRAWQRKTNHAKLENFVKHIDKEISALKQKGMLKDKMSPTSKGGKGPQPTTKGAQNPANQWTEYAHHTPQITKTSATNTQHKGLHAGTNSP